MTVKLRRVAIGLFAVLVASCALFTALAFNDGPSTESFAQIKEGMAKAEVESLLGVSIGKCGDVPLPDDQVVDLDFWGGDGVTQCYVWHVAGGEIRVGFGVDGKAAYGSCIRTYPRQESYRGKFRRWLGFK